MEAFRTLWQDLRYAARGLRQSPGFTLAAVASLALGIGANTAVFSVVEAVLLRPLPYPDADRLVRVAQQVTRDDVSVPEYEFWREHASAFASVAGYRSGGDREFVSGGRSEWVPVTMATTDFFRTLGIAPALGREFNPGETAASGPRAIVLSDGLWRRAFGSDRGVLGRVVTVGGAMYTVVGVLPRDFWLPRAAEAFVPLRPTGGAADEGANTEMIARLQAGVGLKQAEASMATVTESFRRAQAGRTPRGYRGLTLIPYREWLAGDVRLTLLLLFGAAGLLLLIACTNLASLLLARLASRRKEIAVRLALGSSPGRLLRQFVTENMLLSATGGLAGFLCAWWLLDALLALIPLELPASAPIRLDAGALTFALAVAAGVGLLFSVAPFLQSWRLDIQQTLRGAGRSSTEGARQRGRSLLVVSEVALSVTLLAGAALLIQSLYRMYQERLGFAPQGVMTFWTPPPTGGFRDGGELRNFESALLERLQAAPGVRTAAAVNVLPLTDQNNFPVEREGRPDQGGGLEVRLVTPAYFETMGIPVLRGRSFSGRDTASGPPVVLINEALALRWWRRANPLGDRLVVGRFRGEDLAELKESPREVVGVVADTKTVYLKAPPRPTVYLPAAQASWYTLGMAWVVRADGAAGLADQLRRAVAEVAPRQKVERMRSMDEIVESTTADSRFAAWLFGVFAGIALLLTATGVYGLLLFSVARRTNEIGTRVALGATRGDVLRLVLKQGIGLVVAGLAVGLAAALALTRSLESLLFGVRPADPFSFAAVSALLLAVGLVASYLPARRAAKVDPIVALRQE